MLCEPKRGSSQQSSTVEAVTLVATELTSDA
jgi:hypothetical protein